jgi:hypothetical protein
VQIRASVELGGRSLSQYSQFGRSSSAMIDLPLCQTVHGSRTNGKKFTIERGVDSRTPTAAKSR